MKLKSKAFSIAEIVGVLLIILVSALIVFNIVIKKPAEEIDNEVSTEPSTQNYANNYVNNDTNTNCGTYDIRCLFQKHEKKTCPQIKALQVGMKNEVSNCILFIGVNKDRLALLDYDGVNRLIGYSCEKLGEPGAKCGYYTIYGEGDDMKCFNSNFIEYKCD